MMIKLWIKLIKILRKRKNNPNLKSNKMKDKTINKINKNLVLNSNNKSKFKLKRKKENLDLFHIVLIILSGKRKIDWKKVKKCLLLQEDILILKGLSNKEVGYIILIHQVLSLTLNLPYKADKLIMLIYKISN